MGRAESSISSTVLFMTAAVNLLGAGIFIYYYYGGAKYVGDYMGLPILLYNPPPGTTVLALAVLALALALYFASPYARRRSLSRLWLAGMLTIILGTWALILAGDLYRPRMVVYGGPTDSYVLEYRAAELVLHGVNPYTYDFARDLLERLALTKATFIFDGSGNYTASHIVGFVSRFDYPAYAALHYVPAALLGVNGAYWDALLLGAALGLLYLRLPEPEKYAFLLLTTAGNFTLIAGIYMNDPQAGWVVPILLALALSDRPAAAGILLAIASSYRQTAVIFTLFFLLAYAREGGDWRRLLKYYLLAAAIINGPFLLASPREFVSNNLLPARLDLYPWGYGLTSLRYAGIPIPREANLALYATVLLAGLALVAFRYSLVRPVALALPGLAFIFYFRPFPVYYMYFLYFNAVWLLLRHPEGRGGEWERRVLVLALSSMIIIVSTVVAGLPRSITLLSSRATRIALSVLLTSIIAVVVAMRSHAVQKRLPRGPAGWGLIARFALVSLLAAILVQSAYPSTRILVYTPQVVDNDSIASSLGAERLLHGQSPYGNYSSQIRGLVARGEAGYIFKLVPYGPSAAEEAARAHRQENGRILVRPGGNLSLVELGTGPLTRYLLFTPLAGRTGSSLLAGASTPLTLLYAALILALYWRSRDSPRRPWRLAVYAYLLGLLYNVLVASPITMLSGTIMVLILLLYLSGRPAGPLEGAIAGLDTGGSALALDVWPHAWERRRLLAAALTLVTLGFAAGVLIGGGSGYALYGLENPVLPQGVSFSHILASLGSPPWAVQVLKLSGLAAMVWVLYSAVQGRLRTALVDVFILIMVLTAPAVPLNTLAALAVLQAVRSVS